MEDGHPFCPNCHAPQIRVPVRPPTAPVTEPMPPGTPEDLQPPAEPMLHERNVYVARQEPELPLQAGNKLIWRKAISVCLMAGLVAAVGSSVPMIPLVMLCMFASGGLAVTLYRRRVAQRTVTPWMGAKLGLLAGGMGFGVRALLMVLALFGAEQRAEVRKLLMEKIQEAAASAADPESRQIMDQLRGYIGSDHGLVVLTLAGVALLGLFLLAFSGLGGALGAAVFGRASERKE